MAKTKPSMSRIAFGASVLVLSAAALWGGGRVAWGQSGAPVALDPKLVVVHDKAGLDSLDLMIFAHRGDVPVRGDAQPAGR